MKIISEQQVHQCLNFDKVINALKKGFAKPAGTPTRQVFELSENENNHDAFAVLPAWNDEVVGVKSFTYFPSNSDHGYKSLYSKIMLFNRAHGEPLALVDGTSVTLWRTAAVSALASQYLSRVNSKHLIFFGTGNLSTYMIGAHISVRNIEKVTIIARNHDKAQSLQSSMKSKYPNIEFLVGKSDEATIRSADIISCGTGSHIPLFDGNWLSEGTHIDLIGNHYKQFRECDTKSVIRSKVFVDSKKNVLNEAGELLIPIAEGVFSEQQVVAELSQFHELEMRRSDDITLFKSVGTALSDLLTANLVFKSQL